jgi:hypothetical protein
MMKSGKDVLETGAAGAGEGPGQSHAADRVTHDFAIVVQELQEFLDPDVVPDWLLTEQFSLGGRTPLQALRDGDLAEVLRAVSETEHGSYI